VLIVRRLCAPETLHVLVAEFARTMFASARRDGLDPTVPRKDAKWLQTALDTDTASKERAIVRRVGRATSARLPPLVLAIAATGDCVSVVNVTAEVDTAERHVSVRNALRTAPAMGCVFERRSPHLAHPCNVLATRDTMDMIARCPRARTIAPTTAFATMALATATSNGGVSIARRTWTLARTTAPDTVSVHKSSANACATRSSRACRAISGSTPPTARSLILAETIAREMACVSTKLSTIRALPWVANARRERSRLAA
jgi:hypothetical protein